MKTLVIHPQDATTDFLKPIYQNLNCKVITGQCTKAEVYEQVAKHDRIIMLGHGSPNGLFAVSQFIGEQIASYIIDESFVDLLKEKRNNVYIWCHADRYVNKYGLTGFYTGMFSSEVLEAAMYDINAEDEEIGKSNDLFSDLVGERIEHESEKIHRYVKDNYILSGSQVRDFNYERIYWR
jgi:hypothetical protein